MRIIMLVLLLAALLQAGDFNGTWKADYTAPDGHQRQTKFILHVKDSALTGQVVNSNEEMQIQEGKVNGDAMSFTILRNMEGEQLKLKFTGEMSGDSILIKIDYGDGAFEITAKRVPS
jgi:hypothetical protein